jgi:hypothetical protein
VLESDDIVGKLGVDLPPLLLDAHHEVSLVFGLLLPPLPAFGLVLGL